MIKKYAIKALILLLSIAMFYWIWQKTDWHTTLNTLKNASLFWIIMGIVPMLLAHYLRAARWNQLTQPLGYTLNKRRSFYAVLSGYLVNVATSRGGEVARSAMAAKSEKAPVETLIGTVVVERLVDLIMLMLMAVLSLFLQYSQMSNFLLKPLKPLLGKIRLFPTWTLILTGLISISLGVMLLLWARKKWILPLLQTNQNKETEETTGILGTVKKFTQAFKTLFILEKPISFWLMSIGIWLGYWLGMFCQTQAIPATQMGTIPMALAFMMFSAFGIIVPLPAGAGVWAAIAFGLEYVYGFSGADSQTFGMFSAAYNNLLMIIFGGIAYILYILEIQKIEKSTANSINNQLQD